MSQVCRLCCSADTKLTNLVNDDVIVNFLDFVPSIALSDHYTLSSRVCQLCFGKAKICVDFVNKIQQSQKNFNTKGRISVRPVQSMVKYSGVATAQDALNKMKRIGGINIKKVEKKKTDPLFNEDSDDSFSWPMEPGNEWGPDPILDKPASTTSWTPAKSPFKPVKRKVSDTKEVVLLESDSDEDYQPAAHYSDSDDEPLQQKKQTIKRTRTSNAEEDYTPSAKKPVRPETQKSKQIIVNSPIKFTCAKCKNSFASIEELSTHMRSKTCFNDKFHCSVCGKSFFTKEQARKHMNVHKDKVSVFCDQCGKEYKNSADLNNHLESVHKIIIRKNGIFHCSKCPDVLTSHLNLVNHMKKHDKETETLPKLCEICAKECHTKKAYRAHIANHQKQRTHPCLVCGKMFFEKFQVTQHMHIHSGIKEYNCDFCEKSYAKRDSLRLHKKKYHPDEVSKSKRAVDHGKEETNDGERTNEQETDGMSFQSSGP